MRVLQPGDLNALQAISSRIREARLRIGKSQAEIAAAANISLSQMNKIEQGKVDVKLSTFVRIATALQSSADDLIRIDAPGVSNLYGNEFTELLSDCTPSEIDSILKILKELKETLHKNTTGYSE